MGAVHLHIAIGADNSQAGALQIACHVQQQVQRAAIGPVEVLKNNQQRLDVRGIPKEAAHGLEQSPAVVLGVTGRPHLDLYAVTNLGHDTGHIGCAGTEVAL